MTATKRPRGRPRRTDGASDRNLTVRVTDTEYRAYEAAAAQAGQSLSHYVRQVLGRRRPPR